MLLEGGKVGDSLCWWWRLALGWLAQHLSCSSSPPFLVPGFRPARPEGGSGRGWCCLEGGRGSEVTEQALIVGTTPEVATGAEADLLFTPSRQAGRLTPNRQSGRRDSHQADQMPPQGREPHPPHFLAAKVPNTNTKIQMSKKNTKIQSGSQ